MAAEDTPDNGNRATVALVYRAVDDLSKLTAAHFETINVRLDSLSILPLRVEAIERVIEGLKSRIARIEDDDQSQLTDAQRKRAWRSTALPTIALMFLGVVLSGLGVLIAYIALSGPNP